MSKDIVRWVVDCTLDHAGARIFRSVLECVMRHDDSITQELALVIERECNANWKGGLAAEVGLAAERDSRIEWGGQRPDYVAKTCQSERNGRPSRPPIAPDVARRAHADALASAEPTDRIAARHGISRATLYRLYKKGPP